MFIYIKNPAYGITVFVVGYYQNEVLKDVVIQYRITQMQENCNLS